MKEIIQEYRTLRTVISELIAISGYKNSFIAQKLGILAPNFSEKKKKGNWTEDELEKILDIIGSEELEDHYLGTLMKKRKEENEEYISLDQFKLEFA